MERWQLKLHYRLILLAQLQLGWILADLVGLVTYMDIVILIVDMVYQKVSSGTDLIL